MKQILMVIVIAMLSSFSAKLKAQTAIMDANVAWTTSGGGNYSGVLTVYLTDSTNVSGIQVNMGSHPDSSDIYTVTYNGATNGNFGNNASVAMQSNDLAVSLGPFTYHSDYYIDIKVYLQGNSYKEIAIHSSN